MGFLGEVVATREPDEELHVTGPGSLSRAAHMRYNLCVHEVEELPEPPSDDVLGSL